MADAANYRCAFGSCGFTGDKATVTAHMEKHRGEIMADQTVAEPGKVERRFGSDRRGGHGDRRHTFGTGPTDRRNMESQSHWLLNRRRGDRRKPSTYTKGESGGFPIQGRRVPGFDRRKA